MSHSNNKYFLYKKNYRLKVSEVVADEQNSLVLRRRKTTSHIRDHNITFCNPTSSLVRVVVQISLSFIILWKFIKNIIYTLHLHYHIFPSTTKDYKRIIARNTQKKTQKAINKRIPIRSSYYN